MKNFTLAILFSSLISFSQTQIGSDIDGEASDDRSGFDSSLSSNGNVLVIGAPNNNGNGSLSGHVRVFENQSGSWAQIGSDIDGEAAGDQFGYKGLSISADGSIFAAGARYNSENGVDSGHVRVFENQSGSWVQIGSDIDGEAAEDEFGYSVSLSTDGSIVAIGAIFNDGNGVDSGHVRVFENQMGSWVQIGSDIDGEVAGDQFGYSVDLSSDGSIVAIGGRRNDGNGDNSGHVRVFENQMGSWVQIGSDIDGEAAGDELGCSLSLSADGSILAVGAFGNDTNGNSSGQVSLFKNESGTWTQIGSSISGEAAGDLFGYSTSISDNGSVVASGAMLNDGNGNNSGHVRVYDLNAVLSNENFIETHLKVYPNPTKNKLVIQLNKNIEFKEANLYNYLGQFVASFRSNDLNLTGLSKGFYFLKIETNKGNTTKKIIKE